MIYYFKKDKSTTEIQKKEGRKMCAIYEESAGTEPTCQKWFAKFCIDIPPWTMLHSQVDQLKWTAIKLRTINILQCRRWLT